MISGAIVDGRISSCLLQPSGTRETGAGVKDRSAASEMACHDLISTDAAEGIDTVNVRSASPAMRSAGAAKTGAPQNVGIEPGPVEKDKVKVSLLPQDPMISEPETVEIDRRLIGTELKGPRFLVEDERVPTAIADTEGNYLFPLSDQRFDQANSFAHCTKTLEMLERFTGHKVPWSSGAEALVIRPAVESDISCYNDQKGSLEFNFFDSSALGRTVRASRSADTISHELGHAFLGGLRPDYMRNWDDETMAFHEAFADITTLLYSIQYDSTISAIIKETGGNLGMPNRMAQRSEEIGLAKHLDNSDPGDDNRAYLRTAINDFTYTPPSELPWGADEGELAAEYHSFSRIFSGAFYECFHTLYDSSLKGICRNPDGSGRAPSEADMAEAIRASRDTIGVIFGRSLDSLPMKKVTFREAAQAMLQADDTQFGGAQREMLRSVFTRRQII
jgi:hypothetical protein